MPIYNRKQGRSTTTYNLGSNIDTYTEVTSMLKNIVFSCCLVYNVYFNTMYVTHMILKMGLATGFSLYDLSNSFCKKV